MTRAAAILFVATLLCGCVRVVRVETGDVTVWVTVDDSRDGFLTGDMKGERAGNDGP